MTAALGFTTDTCTQIGSPACCVQLASASACVRANLLHVDDSTAIIVDSCSQTWGGAGNWAHCTSPDLGQPARDELSAICAAHGGPWCEYLESVRHDRAGDLSLALAMALATVLAIISVRRRAARLARWLNA